MPKLNNRPPKYSKMGKYAVVYYGGKSHYLGRYGSDESKVAYSRLLAEIQASPTGVPLPKEERHVTVRELALTMRRQRTATAGRPKIPHWYPYQLRHSASTATKR